MWASQVWSPHPRQTCPEGTEQRVALITQGSRCHIVTVKHPVPRCHVVLSPPTAAAMTTQTMALLAQQMQRECPLKYGKLNQSHCLSDSLFASSCLLSAVLSSSMSESVHEKSQPAAWKTEYVTMEWELIGCHQFPMWHWDFSLNAAGTWDSKKSHQRYVTFTCFDHVSEQLYPQTLRIQDWKCDFFCGNFFLLEIQKTTS